MRIGILGAGHIAGKVSGTLKQMPEVRCYAIAARDLWRAEAFAGEHGFDKAYGSYEELVRDPDVDLVYVATPHNCHYPHVRLALENGKPVLCEKSFMMNAREAEEVIALARQKGLLLAEAIWTRYMPFSKTIRDVVESGVIGNVRMLSANLGYAVDWKERLVKPELGGGALLDLGVYCLNFALMYFDGEISDIKTACVKNEFGVDMQESIPLFSRRQDRQPPCHGLVRHGPPGCHFRRQRISHRRQYQQPHERHRLGPLWSAARPLGGACAHLRLRIRVPRLP